MQVDVWINNENINFALYGEKPVFKTSALYVTHILNDHSLSHNHILSMRRHEIET